MGRGLAVIVTLVLAAMPALGAGTEEEAAAAAQGALMAGTPVTGEPYVDHIFASPADYEAATGNAITQFGEAPMLAALVAEGQLPPVEERIPQDAQVVRPLSEIGQYGGVLNAAGPEFEPGEFVEDLQQAVAKWPPDGSVFIPNLVRGWELSADATMLTLQLRRGMKWSDGEDADADDFLFFYDAILNDEVVSGFTPEPRGRYTPGGELMQAQKLDQYTVRYTFAEPFLAATESWAQSRPLAPQHYLQQWHIRYNSDAGALAKEEGFEEWYEAFAAHHSDRGHTGSLPVAYSYTDMPVTDPYVLNDDSPGVQYWERNPFYWKIDTAGNQLPYIDGVQRAKFTKPDENIPARAMAGEIDVQLLFTELADFPVYKQNESSGDYRVYLWDDTASSFAGGVTFNYTHKDPVLREIFNDIRFRQAMSLAIDREEISKTLFFGRSKPFNSPASSTWTGFEDWMATYYAEHDPERANELLDEMGLARGADGKRMRPDGQPLVIDGTYPALDYLPYFDDLMTLLARYWTALGIGFEPKAIAYALWKELGEANELDAGFWSSDGGGEVLGHSRYPLRLRPPWHWYHCCPQSSYPWAQWHFTAGKEGEEPPDEIKALFDLSEQWLKEQKGTARYAELANELITRNVEGLYYIGTVTPPPRVVIVNNRVGNMFGEGGFTGLGFSDGYLYDTLYIKQ